MTNSSLAVSSASLTHLIKMSEPVFTSFILAALGRITVNCDLVLIMFSVVISAIGSEPLSRKYIQALLSLGELLHYCAFIGRELYSDATLSLLCHKEPVRGTKSPLLGTFLTFHWFFMA